MIQRNRTRRFRCEMLESRCLLVAGGILLEGSQLFHLDSEGVPGDGHSEDEFGYALAAGDFDGDGVEDLAVGVPFAEVEGEIDAGKVHVFYGSPEGFSRTRNEE